MTTSFIKKKSMAEDNLTWIFDNEFVPLYIPPNVKYFESDGLETWYRQNKCKDFLENTEETFCTKEDN